MLLITIAQGNAPPPTKENKITSNAPQDNVVTPFEYIKLFIFPIDNIKIFIKIFLVYPPIENFLSLFNPFCKSLIISSLLIKK